MSKNIPNTEFPCDNNVQVDTYSQNPGIRVGLLNGLPYNTVLVPDRYWLLTGKDSLGYLRGVGRIVFAVATKDFKHLDIGTRVAGGGITASGIRQPAAYLGLTMPDDSYMRNMDVVVNAIIGETNESLEAFRLPPLPLYPGEQQ